VWRNELDSNASPRALAGMPANMRNKLRIVLLLVAVALAATATVAVAGKGPKAPKGAKAPAEYTLPAGWQPEGIAAGTGHTFYVGSIATGAIARIDAKTGAQTTAVPGAAGRAAIGIEYDRRTNRLYVAGGPTGKAFVYDAGTGQLLAELQLTPPTPAGNTFINDVVVTKRGAYFTDSRQPTVYFVPRDLNGVTPIALQGFHFVADQLNLNGIEASRNGKWLFAVQTTTGVLWRIDAQTGQATKVDLGGSVLTGGDGLLFVSAKKLVVVQNRLNQAVVVKLSSHSTAGRVTKTYTSDRFDIPTTVAKLGSSLLFVNARFGTAGDPATAAYWVTRLKR
jgi:sugar lactone lactonase YvrE